MEEIGKTYPAWFHACSGALGLIVKTSPLLAWLPGPQQRQLWPALHTDDQAYLCRAMPDSVVGKVQVKPHDAIFGGDDQHVLTVPLAEQTVFAGEDVYQSVGRWIGQRMKLHQAMHRADEQHDAWQSDVTLELAMTWRHNGLDDCPFVNAKTGDPNTFLLAAKGDSAGDSLAAACMGGTLRWCAGPSCAPVLDFFYDEVTHTTNVTMRYPVPVPSASTLRRQWRLHSGDADALATATDCAKTHSPYLTWAQGITRVAPQVHGPTPMDPDVSGEEERAWVSVRVVAPAF